MKDFFKVVLACTVSIVIVGIMLPIFGIVSLVNAVSSENGSVIKENSVLFLDLEGMLEERAEEMPFASVMGESFQTYGLDDILASIKEAKEDKNIKGIYLQAGMMEAEAASLEEIRGELASFKESGKFVVAYGDQYSQGMYYLASVADKVIVNPSGSIAWHGLSSQPIFFTNVLEKLGIEMQIFKVGTYKSAVEPFIATEMSDANREQVTEYMNSVWGDMIAAVSASRGISVDKLNEYADRSMDLRQAREYVECGLADTLLYKDGVLDYLKSLTGVEADDKLSLVRIKDIKENLKTESILADLYDSKIAVYYAFGEIDSSTSADEGINSDKVTKELRELREDESVKAVVLRVNSPGGSAYGSEQIWREVCLLKAAKPVVVSMGDYAASGGYYISCAADRIVANSTTLTGSIGIFGMIPSVEKLLNDKIGLEFDLVKTNKFADMGTLSRPFNDAEKAIMQEYIEEGYKLFLKRCADGRGMSVEDIDKIGQGRVWTGSKAVELGLVDEIGDLDKAIDIAALLAEVEEYEVVSYPAESDFMTRLLDEDKGEYLETMAQKALGDYYRSVRFIRNIRNYHPVQARMPFELNIR